MSLSMAEANLILGVFKLIFNRSKKKNQEATSEDEGLIQLIENIIEEKSKEKALGAAGFPLLSEPPEKISSVEPLIPAVPSPSGDAILLEVIDWKHRYIKSKWGGETLFVRALNLAPITLHNVKADKRSAKFEPPKRGSFHFMAIKDGVCDAQEHSSHQVSAPWSKRFYGVYDYCMVVHNDPKNNRILGRSLVTKV